MSTKWKDLFYYDEASPSCLRWKTDVYNSLGKKTASGNVGDIAGSSTKDSAYRVGVSGEHVLCHRIIWEMFNGEIGEENDIDHFDGNRLNNQISNLRLVNRKLNNRNKKRYSNNCSGVTGVKFICHKGLDYWIAQWHTSLGVKKTKWFSCNKYGYEKSFEMACEVRAKMLQELNSQGAGYTVRHGT